MEAITCWKSNKLHFLVKRITESHWLCMLKSNIINFSLTKEVTSHRLFRAIQLFLHFLDWFNVDLYCVDNWCLNDLYCVDNWCLNDLYCVDNWYLNDLYCVGNWCLKDLYCVDNWCLNYSSISYQHNTNQPIKKMYITRF